MAGIEDILTTFRTSAATDHLAHAWIVEGPPHLNAERLVIPVLQSLMCETGIACGECSPCKRVAAKLHPDVAWIEPRSKSRIIRVDEIRDLIKLMEESSFEGGWKAGVILDADRVPPAAVHAKQSCFFSRQHRSRCCQQYSPAVNAYHLPKLNLLKRNHGWGS